MDQTSKASRARAIGLVAAASLALGLGAAMLFHAATSKPLLPPIASAHTEIKPTPNVLVSVRDLRRLESAEMHMERVMDVRNKQDHLFGLATSEDAMLLVAAGDVTAGVDFEELKESDVVIDWEHKSAKVTLPPSKILSSRIDNEHTYVYSRSTDLLAKRHEALESEARANAEKEITKAAVDTGILDRSDRNAARTVENLVRSLGFDHVEVTTRSKLAITP